MAGTEGVVECTFVKSSVTEVPYFSSPVLLGKNGAEEVYGMGKLSDFEKKKLAEEVQPTCTVAMFGFRALRWTSICLVVNSPCLRSKHVVAHSTSGARLC